MRKLISIFLVCLAACTSVGRTPDPITTANNAIYAYANAVDNAYLRGRISREEATKALKNAQAARDLIEGCKDPCDTTSVVQSIQQYSFELERKLREQEKK